MLLRLDLPGCVYYVSFFTPTQQCERFHSQVNSAQDPAINVPFGGYKQSGIGRELGEYALDTYVISFAFLDRFFMMSVWK